jgi:hypothetical protein
MHESFRNLKAAWTDPEDETGVAHALKILGRPRLTIDSRGYKCWLLGAACDVKQGRLCYVESKEKKRWWTRMVDISIKIHLVNDSGLQHSIDIKSYNPYFGCVIEFFRWIADTAFLIYREKHRTYVVRINSEWPPKFQQIDHRWIINGDILSFGGHNGVFVSELSLPSFEILPNISISEAKRLGRLPTDTGA